ncbi:hypothetical protein COCSUDRAFT_67654 [Coccomyxa subellipsoidea C-169]|uniref:Expansin-like EG45 domain-containing protein n=1 Tax=Coccomyxa subellipsoidea (strain C-169) TaxID=574566 RepID=I0YNK2_COCSC|nr:hypothetical protein COCSUDRAFT_67654 [Coccomyxa subellipsoidea C-169]EIE19971.1 hypothetical protein COCSUDRAFT_67654 [Coccomyxa subellipsoidea C-169]|eukprot:XP_005644515.1 hypothetical protein COCSUDRAFT_67654 [Coccomyxa subellipsoidea C-169]
MGCAQWAPAAFLLAALLLAGQAAGQANAPEVPGAAGGWRQGRATFYGGPESFLQNFDDRGPPPEYGFGSAVYGSCGYTQQNFTEGVTYDNVPYPKDMLMAVANIDADFPGSCGRCYEVRCRSGFVLSNGTEIYNTSLGYSLPAKAPNALDDFGRRWLGNPTANQSQQSVQCWDDDASIYVVVTDSCPCIQTDVNTGAVTGTNPPCCGDIYHMDLTYWGFQKLAHPLNGIISTSFRPVDCNSKQPLQFSPGFINQTIYGDKVETGWGWFPYKHNTVTFWSQGYGVGGSNATCISLGPKQGGITLACRECGRSGYQPFKGASALEFWIRDQNGSSTIPDVQVGAGDYDKKQYCASVKTGSLSPVERQGLYAKFSVPLSSFSCPFAQDQITQVSFQNADGQLVSFCLDGIQIIGGSGRVQSSSIGRHRI